MFQKKYVALKSPTTTPLPHHLTHTLAEYKRCMLTFTKSVSVFRAGCASRRIGSFFPKTRLRCASQYANRHLRAPVAAMTKAANLNLSSSKGAVRFLSTVDYARTKDRQSRKAIVEVIIAVRKVNSTGSSEPGLGPHKRLLRCEALQRCSGGIVLLFPTVAAVPA
jgi:hypothetical protein